MGAYLANRGCAGLDERIDIISCCALIIFVAQVFLCSNEINNPIRERFSINAFEQRWEFEVRMKIYEPRHENSVRQPDNAMGKKPFFDVVFRTDCQNGPSIDHYRTILYDWGPG